MNDSGAVLGNVAYDPWGQVQQGTVPTFGFTGELQQGNNVYLRARWYNAQQGTFTARDSFAGWPEQPYSLMPYQYAYAAPTTWTDPRGRAVSYGGDGGYGPYCQDGSPRPVNGQCQYTDYGDTGANTGGYFAGLPTFKEPKPNDPPDPLIFTKPDTVSGLAIFTNPVIPGEGPNIFTKPDVLGGQQEIFTNPKTPGENRNIFCPDLGKFLDDKVELGAPGSFSDVVRAAGIQQPVDFTGLQGASIEQILARVPAGWSQGVWEPYTLDPRWQGVTPELAGREVKQWKFTSSDGQQEIRLKQVDPRYGGIDSPKMQLRWGIRVEPNNPYYGMALKNPKGDDRWVYFDDAGNASRDFDKIHIEIGVTVDEMVQRYGTTP